MSRAEELRREWEIERGEWRYDQRVLRFVSRALAALEEVERELVRVRKENAGVQRARDHAVNENERLRGLVEQAKDVSRAAKTQGGAAEIAARRFLAAARGEGEGSDA